MSADIHVGRVSVDSRSILDRQSIDTRSIVDRLSIDSRPSVIEYRSSVDRLSTATSTDIAVDIAVDITYSKHDLLHGFGLTSVDLNSNES